ncbi:MAG TPA: extracellular solute-binding protein [Solirubrobacteraceae bacterium]|jgi:iron(III) transport system substrate-binding protein
MRAPRRRLAATGAVVCALLAAGCGSPTSSEDDGTARDDGLAAVADEVRDVGASERERALTEMARKEGRLELYTSLDADLAPVVAERFEKRYGIKVRVFRASAEDVATRVIEEARAGRVRGDVAEASGLTMELLSNEGELAAWEPAGADRLPASARFDDWTASRTNRYVLSWNTERVPAAERPRTWDDLADPRWRGKVVMEISDSDFARTLVEHWVSSGASRSEAEKRFAAIAANARFVDGHSLQAELLATGEFDAAAAAYAYHMDQAADEGSPVAWQPAVSPTVTRPNGPGVLAGAPHPAAAALFVDWLTGAGQEDLRKLGVEPVRTDLAEDTGVDTAPIDLDAYLAEQEDWQAKYDRYVQLGGKGPSD